MCVAAKPSNIATALPVSASAPIVAVLADDIGETRFIAQCGSSERAANAAPRATDLVIRKVPFGSGLPGAVASTSCNVQIVRVQMCNAPP